MKKQKIKSIKRRFAKVAAFKTKRWRVYSSYLSQLKTILVKKSQDRPKK